MRAGHLGGNAHGIQDIPAGTYASVNGDLFTMEFKSGGVVTMTTQGLGSSSGTYTVDGEMLIVVTDWQTHTFIREGNCIEEPRQIFGTPCKG